MCHQIEQFLWIDSARRHVTIRMTQLTQAKEQFYGQILREEIPNLDEFLSRARGILAGMNELERSIVSLQRRNAGRMEMRMILYYFNEVKEDFIQGILLQNTLKEHSNINSFIYKGVTRSLFNNKISRLSVAFRGSGAAILYYSDHVPGLFHYDKNEFQYIKNLNDLIPPPISQYHD